jgi:phage shock protein C
MAQYCSNCGKPLPAGARACPSCGHAVGGAYEGAYAVPPSMAQRRLVRPRAGRVIAGVCQGIANMYGWDVTLIRVLAVLLAFFSGIGLLAYIVIWVVAPEEAYALPPASPPPPR